MNGLRLADQVCLVTGGSRGIGAAVVRAVAAQGAMVAINYNRSEPAARMLAQDLEARGARVMAIKADVSRAEEVEAMFAQVEAHLGMVNLLVNNAGISFRGLITDTSEEDWDRIMAVNLKAAFLCCRRAIPPMIRQGGGGIVNMSSIWGCNGGSYEVAYAASKGALNAFTRALAGEVGPSGIRVNAIAPGPVSTNMLKQELDTDEMELLAEEIPLGRLGRPEEIADACVYLLSGRSSYVNGHILVLDGGWKA